MCGIAGMVCRSGLSPSLDEQGAARWRDLLAHRGPDGAGQWRRKNALLLHRRLSVIDPTEAGSQPMLWPPTAGGSEPRFALVYNGMLYNDADLRRELSARGVRFRTACDTETVLAALATWGPGALDRFRGMYALALYDTARDTLLLARDPVGIKPLSFWCDGRELVFASEAWAVAAHPSVPRRPNPRMCAAYLTTIRTVLGNETMYEGVISLRPGQSAFCDFGGERITVALKDPTPSIGSAAMADADQTRAVIEGSVNTHLRADVETCCLLSGGLDSAVVTSVARRAPGGDRLRTYCAGAALPVECGDVSSKSDFRFARECAAAFGTRHSEAPVTPEHFIERWAWMVERLGVPLSTPNEVAIWTVADRLRRDGYVVTVSGEGADELFGGYEGPVKAAWACAERIAAAGLGAEHAAVAGAATELHECAWVPLEAWDAVLNEGVRSERDWLSGWYAGEFAHAIDDVGGVYGVGAHLRLHQRVNLVGLLQRLDTATMLAGVEGRTPFADREVMAFANALPVESRCRVTEPVGVGATTGGGGGAPGSPESLVETKINLREGFADDLPESVVRRPKASFPLPFQGWLAGATGALDQSPLARELFTDAARALVAQRPEELWRFAWPMVNLALWGRSF